MIREQLIDAILENDSPWSCPEYKCEMGVSCRDCAEKQLAEYEAKIKAEAIEEVISLAKAEIDFESQAEQKRFVEFMRALKEQNPPAETEVWQGYHGKTIVAPKGTFDAIYNEAKEQKSCADCILDQTDACTRGAGRVVDEEICKEFLEEQK